MPANHSGPAADCIKNKLFHSIHIKTLAVIYIDGTCTAEAAGTRQCRPVAYLQPCLEASYVWNKPCENKITST